MSDRPAPLPPGYVYLTLRATNHPWEIRVAILEAQLTSFVTRAIAIAERKNQQLEIEVSHGQPAQSLN